MKPDYVLPDFSTKLIDSLIAAVTLALVSMLLSIGLLLNIVVPS